MCIFISSGYIYYLHQYKIESDTLAEPPTQDWQISDRVLPCNIPVNYCPVDHYISTRHVMRRLPCMALPPRQPCSESTKRYISARLAGPAGLPLKQSLRRQ